MSIDLSAHAAHNGGVAPPLARGGCTFGQWQVVNAPDCKQWGALLGDSAQERKNEWQSRIVRDQLSPLEATDKMASGKGSLKWHDINGQLETPCPRFDARVPNLVCRVLSLDDDMRLRMYYDMSVKVLLLAEAWNSGKHKGVSRSSRKTRE